jgi:tripartite-type tricarboxylate transporter receptor subunit TctC
LARRPGRAAPPPWSPPRWPRAATLPGRSGSSTTSARRALGHHRPLDRRRAAKTLKQSFIIENKPGASGNIGADAVAKSEPDGYTLLIGIDTAFTVNPHIYKSLPFKPADFRPVMVMASSGMLVGVHPKTGYKTLAELVAAGQKKNINFASAGSGSPATWR